MSSTTFLCLSSKWVSELKLISAFLNAREIFIAIVLGVVTKIWTVVVQILVINRGYKNIWLHVYCPDLAGNFRICILFFEEKMAVFCVTSAVKSACLEISDRKFAQPKLLLRYVEEFFQSVRVGLSLLEWSLFHFSNTKLSLRRLHVYRALILALTKAVSPSYWKFISCTFLYTASLLFRTLRISLLQIFFCNRDIYIKWNIQ